MIRPGVAVALLAAGCGREGFNGACDAPISTPANVNLAFVTSVALAPLAVGGDLSGADALCTARASAAGLPGHYVALMSLTSINARDRIASARGWVRTDGKPVLDRPDDIATGKLLAPVDLDENGVSVGANTYVLTGTNVTGDQTNAARCLDYTSSTANIAVGNASMTADDWLVTATGSCATPGRVYCFGTDKNRALAIPAATGRHAFLTATSYVPDAGGIATADALCQSEAQGAGLPGTYGALLATATTSAISRFSLSGANWLRLDGIPLAASPVAFAAGQLDVPLNVNSLGNYVDAFGVATGASTPSLAADFPARSCSDWTSTASTVRAANGLANHVTEWFDAANDIPCTGSAIYCLEQ